MTDVLQLLASGLFDPEWYRRQHRLEAVIGSGDLAAAEHFLCIGLARGLDPSRDVDLRFHADLHGFGKGATPSELLHHLVEMPSPAAGRGIDMTRLPWALNRLCRRGRGTLALRLADRLLAQAHRGFRHVLEANLAVRAQDAQGWLAALNAYLVHHALTPVGLQPRRPGQLEALQARASVAVTEGPIVTVIVSAWQAEATIEASLNSLLSQGWRPLEIFAIDDASTDTTPQILHRMARQDPRIRVFRNPVNVGPYVGRNIALGLARGTWICCHDADEWAHPDRLALQMSWLRTVGQPPVSQTGMLRMQPDGTFGQIGRVGVHTVDGALYPCPSSTTFDAAFLRDRLGSWDCARFAADTEMIARASQVTGEHAAFLAKPLVLSLDHPQSLTNRTDTGTGRGSRLSPPRAAYRAHWARRLALSAKGQGHTAMYRPFPPDGRAGLPPDVAVPAEDIFRCLRQSSSPEAPTPPGQA